MTANSASVVADRATLALLRRCLGEHLATYRQAAGISQPELGQAIGRTRSTISRIEHGSRALPATLWQIADELCGADGALVTEHQALVRAERDYRDQCRTQRRQARRAAAQAQVEVLRASPAAASRAVRHGAGGEAGADKELVSGGLAEELLAVVTKMVRSLGRRDAIRLAGWVFTALGLSGLNLDECTRIARAVENPQRVDAQVVQNLAATLTHCKRLEDKLGPDEVLDTVMAQHQLTHRLSNGCPEQFRKPLNLVDSNIASAIGGYLIDMGDFEEAGRYFGHARKAAHDTHNSMAAAYAAANTSFVARLRGDTPTTLDAAAAARSLAARTDDKRLQALAENMASGAYALDGQHGPCMGARARAHDLLASANGSAPDSPAYWFRHSVIDSQYSTYLTLLNRPKEAVDAALTAHGRYDRSYVGGYALCQVRLGHALAFAQEVPEATRVLGEVADRAHLFPRLTAELHNARALLQPWKDLAAVRTLDDRLKIYGLTPN